MSRTMKCFLILVGLVVIIDVSATVGFLVGEDFGVVRGEFQMIEKCNHWMQKQKERLESKPKQNKRSISRQKSYVAQG